MKKNVKRIIALCICCALLAAAVIQNVYSNRKNDGGDADGTANVQSGDEVLADGGQAADTNADADANADVNVDANAGADNEETVPTGILCESVEDYLSGLRLERDQLRSLEAEECMSIIESEETAEDEKTKAQESVQSIGIMQEIESSVETALESKGYEDVFVNYSEDGSIDVTLVAKTLIEEEVMAIALLIETATGVTVDCMSLQSVYEA